LSLNFHLPYANPHIITFKIILYLSLEKSKKKENMKEIFIFWKIQFKTINRKIWKMLIK